MLFECQAALFTLVTKHYMESNPILGSYARRISSFVDQQDKAQFYKQAKEFFFGKVQKSEIKPKTEVSKKEPIPCVQMPFTPDPFGIQYIP
jgi:hypothetical protein